MRALVRRWLGLQGDEERRAWRLLSLVFTSSAALVLVKAAQSGLFLERYGRETIPWAFAASAGVLATSSSLLVALAPRWGHGPLASRTIISVALAFLAMRGLLVLEADWVRFVLYVVIEACAGLLLIQVWSVVGSACNARSARRLLPVAGLGASIAWGLGGFLVKPLTHLFGFESTLIIAPGLLLLSLFALAKVRQHDLVSAPSLRRASLFTSWRRGIQTVVSNPLMRLIAALSLLALLTEQAMDLALMTTAKEALGDAEAIGSFFGRYYGATSVIGMALLAGVSGRVLAALGAPRSLMLMPTAIVVGCVVLLIIPGLGAAVALRGVARVLKQSVWSSSMEQLQSPLSGVRRAQARAAIRGVLAPAGYGIAALLMTLLPGEIDVRLEAAIALVGSSLMCVLVFFRARVIYRRSLHTAIDARRLLLGSGRTPKAPDLDVDACEALSEELSGDDVARSALAAEVLGLCATASASRALRPGLSHAEPEVRRVTARALCLARSEGVVEALSIAAAEDPEPEVRRAALDAWVAHETTEHSPLERASIDPDPNVSCTAKIALAESEHEGEALGEALLPFLCDEPGLERALLALTAAASDARGVHSALRNVLTHGSPDARVLTARTVIRIGIVGLLPDVVDLLKDPRTAPAVAHALVSLGHSLESPEIGERTLAASLSRLADRVARDEEADVATQALVLRLLSHGEEHVRRHATEALGASIARGDRPPLKSSLVAPLLEKDLQRAYLLYSILAGLAHDDGTADWTVDAPLDTLAHEVELRIERARRDVLGRLMLRGRERLVSAVEVARRSPSVARDAQVAELLELELEPALARGVVPLFERMSLRDRFRVAAKLKYVDRSARNQPLDALVALGDPHLEAAAAVAYGARFDEQFVGRRELLSDMVPLYERIRFLRSVPLFRELPSEEVVQLAERVEQVEFSADQAVFNKGDAGEELFVVVRGRVEIKRDGMTVATMGTAEFFGELALLDHQPRSADAIAAEDTQLLRLRGADLEELMARRPAATREIVRVLATRLRSTLR